MALHNDALINFAPMNSLVSKSYRLLLFAVMLISFCSCKDFAKEKDAMTLNQDGIKLMNEGKYDAAVIVFEKAVKDSKLDLSSKGTIYRNLGIAFHEQKILDSAAHFATLAAKCYYKGSYDYLVNMASVDILAGKTSVALTKLLRAVIINPDELAVNNSLGLIYLGDYGYEFTDNDKALKYNKKAYDLSYSRATEDILARNYYELGEYENAETHYDNVYTKYPNEAVYALNSGLAKYKLKKIDEAEQLFKQALAMDSSYKQTIENFRYNNR